MKDERRLMRLPITAAPETDIPAYIPEQRKGWNGEIYEIQHKCFAYKAEWIDDTLTLTVFDHQKNMAFRVFQRKDDYITQFPNKDKPSHASLAYLVDWHDNRYTPADERTDMVIFQFLVDQCWYYRIKKDASGFAALRVYQLQIKKKQLEDRYDRIRAEIDNAMLEIRPLPKKVLQWVDSVPMRHARYIFYDYVKGRKKMQGFCTHCGRQVEVLHPKHRKQGYCPACHSPVTFMARGKFSKNYEPLIRDYGRFAYYQSTKDGWCIRMFSVSVFHGVNSVEKAKYDLHEYARYFFKADEPYSAKLFEWDNFRQTGEYRFCKVGYVDRITNAFVYPANLDKVFRRFQDYKYLPMTDLVRHSGQIDITWLHKDITQYPWMEYLIKLKFYRLAVDVINHNEWRDALNEHGTNFGEVLGIQKAHLPFLQKVNPTARGLAVLKISLSQWNCKDTTILKWLMQNAGYGEAKELMRFVHPVKLKNYLLKQLEVRSEDAKPQKIQWTERTETVEEARKRVMHEITRDWRDYLDECRALGYDMTDGGILLPRDLLDAHTKTSELFEIKKNEGEDPNIRKRAAILAKQYAFENAGLLIRPIADVGELIREGKRLRHCVARYAKDYANGETNIFCIRETQAPKMPYYTLELGNSGKVIQCRGYRNCSTTEEIRKFLSLWQKTFQKKSKKKMQAPVTVVA